MTNTSNTRRRYAIVGVGGRSGMYRRAIGGEYAQHCVIVGFCDTNLGRLRLAQAESKELTGSEPPIYDVKADPNAFDQMIAETRPDEVIVTTIDRYHSDYIVRAMELGCDVTTEKPMTIDAERCRAIIDTQRKTGRTCRVTFNYRYSPTRTQVKDLLMKGTIGDVLSVDFHWMLNTRHGADYFRRWHSNKANSGGLMVHKATHHFDLVNWWLSDVPVSVIGVGKREFYTPEMAVRMGLSSHHERCLTCPEGDKCGFKIDLTSGGFKTLYLDNEEFDGYYRDRCVFRPDIDIEDTMNVIVTYSQNTTLCYSLNAFSAWEGYTICFNGTKGRLEHTAQESVYISGDGTVPGAIKKEGTWIRIFPLREPAYQVDLWTGEGGHGGGDPVLLADIFAPEKKPDPYKRAADQRSGAYSILIGAAANISFETGQPVRIDELVPGLEAPDYPEMPSHSDPLPMPPKA
ncbi:MAG: Gfo/Idh/MocA family oxidoreductase [Armatimonadetes bacterium]|nr:Gfo/Idh/MocA family oxidoreductase [Armatimonadota bacterium]